MVEISFSLFLGVNAAAVGEACVTEPCLAAGLSAGFHLVLCCFSFGIVSVLRSEPAFILLVFRVNQEESVKGALR